MPSPRRASKRRTRRQSGAPAPWDKAVDVLRRRSVVALIWIAAAVLCFLVVAADPMTISSPEQWSRAYSQPEIARGLAILLVLGTVGLLGLGWRRWRGKGRPDKALDEPPYPIGWQVWLGRIGVVLMAVGSLLITGDWLSSHRVIPAGELVLPLHETVESVEVTQGVRTVDVMLPLRTTLRGLDLGAEEPVAEIQFSRPGQDHGTPREFAPAQSLDIDGLRFVFSGFAEDTTRLRALISSPDAETIDVAGVPGDEIQLSVDGPTYRIVDATTDYLDVFAPAPNIDEARAQLMLLAQGYPLGVMGPAVQLEDERGQKFWIYQRAPVEDVPGVDANLRLDELHEVPSAVMTVTSVRALWPFALGLILFIIGWTLLFVFPERFVRRRRDGTVWIWSLNRIEAPCCGGGDDTRWSTLFGGAMSFVALLAVAAAFLFAVSEAAILVLAGLVAALGLPTGVDSASGRRAALAAAAVPLAVMMGVLVVFGVPTLALSMQTEALLWTAQLGSWLAMAAALVGAGVLAEDSLGRRSTGGAVSVALAIWAAMGAVVAMGLGRGRWSDELIGLPLVSDGGAVVWAIPNILSTAELEIAVVNGGGELALLALVVALSAALAVIGVALKKPKVAFAGWIGALVAAVTATLKLMGGWGASGDVRLPDSQPYEALGSTWLRSRELPDWLAEYGAFQVDGGVRVATEMLIPEIFAFSMVAVLALVMIALMMLRHRGHGDVDPTPSPQSELAGRDLFVRAVIFGAMGWVLGLMLSWEYLGAAGILGPMEWLGASTVMLAFGVLLLGWRNGPGSPQRFLRAFGPGLVLCYLVWVLAVGAAGGMAPGASIPLLP